MAKNPIQFQKGLSLHAFLDQYGTEEQCADALFGWRWPGGLVCPECGHPEDFVALHTRDLMQCRHCHHQASLTAGTIFAYTKLPLTVWFLAMYLLTQQKNAISALELKRHLGVSYPTAWRIKHKLLQVMLERDADRQLTGVIEIDDVYWGGEVHGETPGRGSPNKTPFVAAVAKNHEGHPIALRMSVVKGFRKTELAHWAAKFIHPDRIVVSDGLACFRGIADAGIEHQAMVTGSGAGGVELPERKWINTILGNVKTAMKGTYHKAGPRHLPRYLAEFSYRFNRRFDLAAMLPRLGVAAARTPPMPERLPKLAESRW
ncbi:IS1595 family transposase [Thiorhodococcus minor]|uniref:IS1595 family transposase n=1 Tax=Thiorhodococcus minor TaxID=57489 RepID=A0A6M0JSY7_9GAMM|nr:IS1595 family transposase [Thiorhodococcus minor]NEV60349.1 IS1595 family transposase [Thiorhodococcus minor]